ncbi:helix-turn-helix domain-containing protein [Lachnospiraceae bacterium WCA-9-b2]|uniref:Helix-turn-helix domain-containing protein n=1 Tax=Sporofaciens musculi TaxID=2681861 RepID=A0A7X3MIW7_9FIRM|nr:helix-turn-helix transcriptional regulator [Sporofaciens musculi]MXP77212.1 helix-turn-helix domain-containing protein [Sporofaciens musculi]
MKIFGERLRTLRLAHSMTQQTLAELLCSERTTILGWELKDKEPDYQYVVDIADIFDVSIDYLFGRDDFIEKSRKREMSIDNEDPLKSPSQTDYNEDVL